MREHIRGGKRTRFQVVARSLLVFVLVTVLSVQSAVVPFAVATAHAAERGADVRSAFSLLRAERRAGSTSDAAPAVQTPPAPTSDTTDTSSAADAPPAPTVEEVPAVDTVAPDSASIETPSDTSAETPVDTPIDTPAADVPVVESVPDAPPEADTTVVETTPTKTEAAVEPPADTQTPPSDTPSTLEVDAPVAALAAPQVTALAITDNLIANGDFEQGSTNAPTSWVQGGWGTLTPVFSYPVAGVSGNAAAVTVSGYASGDAKWYFTPVAVTAGSQYTFSDQYKATVPTQLVAQYQNASGAFSYAWLADLPAASSWTPATVTNLTIPTGIVSMTIFHLIAANGTLTIDSASLTKAGSTPPPPSNGKGMVSITFDDGWTSQYENALPLLEKYGIKGTFYIISDTLVPGKYDGYMSKAQVLTLHTKGHDIQSHTVTHAHLPKVTAAKLKNELVNSKSAIEAVIGAPVTGLAYPYGEYNAKVITAAKSAGYTNARTVEDETLNTPATDVFKLKSYSPTLSTPLATLKAAIDTANANGQWVIIAFHEINNLGDEYSNTPAYLDAVLQYVEESGIDTVTVSEGLARNK